jgi:hypothetical protein
MLVERAGVGGLVQPSYMIAPMRIKVSVGMQDVSSDLECLLKSGSHEYVLLYAFPRMEL